MRTPEDVDQIISAEIPTIPESLTDEAKDQCRQLRDIVLKCMIHGPCGNRNRNSPCMIDGKCSKGFPKQFQMCTSWNKRSSYPTYRRRSPDSGGETAIVGDYLVDNQFVVPYNPFLSLKYAAHINVEACVSPFAAKYLFLYINKVIHGTFLL